MSQLGYAQNATPTPSYPNQPAQPRPTSVSSALEGLIPILSHLDSISGRLRQCAEAISGARPEPLDETGKDSAPPGNLVAVILDRRAQLQVITDRIEANLQRIESGLS